MIRRLVRSFGPLVFCVGTALVANYLEPSLAWLVGAMAGGLTALAAIGTRQPPSMPERLADASWIMAVYRRNPEDDPAQLDLNLGVFQMNERVPPHAAAMMFMAGATNVAMTEEQLPQDEEDSALLSNARLILGDLLRTYDHVLADLVPGPTRDLLEAERTFYRQQFESLGPGTDDALLNTIVREYAQLIVKVQRRAESG